jgi:hypothetical protein
MSSSTYFSSIYEQNSAMAHIEIDNLAESVKTEN